MFTLQIITFPFHGIFCQIEWKTPKGSWNGGDVSKNLPTTEPKSQCSTFQFLPTFVSKFFVFFEFLFCWWKQTRAVVVYSVSCSVMCLVANSKFVCSYISMLRVTQAKAAPSCIPLPTLGKHVGFRLKGGGNDGLVSFFGSICLARLCKVLTVDHELWIAKSDCFTGFINLSMHIRNKSQCVWGTTKPSWQHIGRSEADLGAV